jgi:hypothetical protein
VWGDWPRRLLNFSAFCATVTSLTTLPNKTLRRLQRRGTKLPNKEQATTLNVQNPR